MPKNCKEGLTDIFIYLLTRARVAGDEKRYRKLYSSANRRNHIDIDRITEVMGE